MGDRYTLTALGSQLQDRFKIEVSESYKPRFNAAPTQLLPVIIQGSKGFSFFYWGQIPNWSKNKSLSDKLLFAESEQLQQKSSLKNALNTRRCIIPMDGYYDWKRISKKGKVAHRIVFNSNEIVSVAAVWEEFEDEQGEVAHTFKIITRPADDIVKEFNNRMPLVLSPKLENEWLDQSKSSEEVLSNLELAHGYQLTSYSVSPAIEDTTKDSERLIAPFAPADQFGNYSLFD